MVPHQKFLNKKNLTEARHARHELTTEILVRHFIRKSRKFSQELAGVYGKRGRGVFFSSRRERRAILNETTHEESFLNQLVEVRELRKRVPRYACCPSRTRTHTSRRRSLLFDDGRAKLSERRLVLNFVMGIGWNARGRIVRPV